MKFITAIAVLMLCVGTGCSTDKQYEVRSIHATRTVYVYNAPAKERAKDMVLVRVDISTGNMCAVGTQAAWYMDGEGLLTGGKIDSCATQH